MENKIQTAVQNGEKKTMQMYIKSMEGEIAKALPSVITPERFTRMVLSAISMNPKLQECSPKTFLGAMMQAAQLGVEPNTPLGQAYILPYMNHGQMEAQFQLGYKGMIDLAYRSGDVSIIQAHVVHQNDEFEYELGLEPKLKHIPAKDNRGDATHVYAMFKTKDGGYGFEVMSIEDCRRHAEKYSKSYNSSSSPWKTNFEEMCKKTVLKSALKYAPLKSDFAKAVNTDETIKSNLSAEMTDVPNEVFADSVVVDGETGEVISNEGKSE